MGSREMRDGVNKLEALAKRLEIAWNDRAVQQESAAALRECAEVLRECAEFCEDEAPDGAPFNADLGAKVRAVIGE